MDFFIKAKKLRVRVAAIIKNEQDEILLIKQSKKNKSYWLLPGGGIEFGESAEIALAQELKEELNLELVSSSFLLLNESIDPDGKKHLIQLVFSVQVNNLSELIIKEKVVKEIQFFNETKIIDIEIRPDIKSYFKDYSPLSSVFISSNWVKE